jgi:aryl-alcohol dehydrogenase-like predicted oxidoreductase
MNTPAFAKRRAGSPPAIAVGAMNFGKRTDARESERIVRRALERGLDVFDTANSYYAGESERILGRALGLDRDRVRLTTKVGIGTAQDRREGLSTAAMTRALEESLGRLGTGHVDLYYLHVPDRKTPLEETLRTMKGFVDSGRVRAWAHANYASWEILEMNLVADASGMPRGVVAQMLYNPIHRELEVEYFAFARKYGVHTSAYNALAGGLLTGRHAFEATPQHGSRFDGNSMYQRRYWTRTMFERVEQLRPVAESEGCSLVELSYAWVASREDVDSILIGPASVEQLDQAIDAVNRQLSPTALKRMEQLAREWVGTDTHYAR